MHHGLTCASATLLHTRCEYEPVGHAVQLFTNSSTVAKVPCGFNKPSGYDALRVELEEKLKGCDSVLYTGAQSQT